MQVSSWTASRRHVDISSKCVKVRWTGGQSDGREQLVERKWLLSSTPEVGKEAKIKLGRSVGAKIWSAIFLGDDREVTMYINM